MRCFSCASTLKELDRMRSLNQALVERLRMSNEDRRRAVERAQALAERVRALKGRVSELEQENVELEIERATFADDARDACDALHRALTLGRSSCST